MNNLVEIVGGRKAAACLTGLVVIVGVFITTKQLPDQLVEAVKYLVTTYLAGNVATDVVDSIGTKLNQVKTDETLAPKIEALKARIDEVAGNGDVLKQVIQVQDQTLNQIVSALANKG